MKTRLLWTLFMLSCLTLPGCLALFAAAGTGATVMYVKGDLDSTLPGSPREVVAATVVVLRDMNMHVLSEDASEIDGRVVARTATDKKVTVTVNQARTTGQSDISIRLNFFGDEELSQVIYDRIRTTLRAGQPTNT